MTNLIVSAVSAVLFGAFGAWRLAVGLHYLGVVKRRIPDPNIDSSLPRFMRADDETKGLVSVLGGSAFLLAAVAVVWAALR